jgi:hypothetical protein
VRTTLPRALESFGSRRCKLEKKKRPGREAESGSERVYSSWVDKTAGRDEGGFVGTREREG